MGRNSHSNEDSEWRRKREVEEAKGGCVAQFMLLILFIFCFAACTDGCWRKPATVPTVAP